MARTAESKENAPIDLHVAPVSPLVWSNSAWSRDGPEAEAAEDPNVRIPATAPAARRHPNTSALTLFFMPTSWELVVLNPYPRNSDGKRGACDTGGRHRLAQVQ